MYIFLALYIFSVRHCMVINRYEWLVKDEWQIMERLRWSRDSVLAFGTQVRGFTPGRSRRIFRAKKILSTPFFGGEVVAIRH
jgi:hypothetical protein